MMLDEESEKIWKFTIAFLSGMIFALVLNMWI